MTTSLSPARRFCGTLKRVVSATLFRVSGKCSLERSSVRVTKQTRHSIIRCSVLLNYIDPRRTLASTSSPWQRLAMATCLRAPTWGCWLVPCAPWWEFWRWIFPFRSSLTTSANSTHTHRLEPSCPKSDAAWSFQRETRRPSNSLVAAQRRVIAPPMFSDTWLHGGPELSRKILYHVKNRQGASLNLVLIILCMT